MTEAVNQRVQQAVGVGQNHEAVVHLNRYLLCILPPFQPHAQQHRSGYCTRQEADGEDYDHRHDDKHSSP